MELTNQQRMYLGLRPVQDHWDAVTTIAHHRLYFDQDTIVKIIISDDNLYREFDTEEQTNNRQALLPKTAKGKEKKLNFTAISGIRGNGTFLSADFDGDGFLKVVNLNTQITFITRYDDEPPISNAGGLQRWIEDFIARSPAGHMEWVADQTGATRKNVKNILPGDIFAFKTGRFQYSFARVICYLPQLKKDGMLGSGRHGMGHVMGKSLVVKPYRLTAGSPDIDLDALIDSPALPAGYMMDNHLFYGENPIIGRRPLREQDLDFPVSFGKTPDQAPVHYLQWGFGHAEKEHNDTLWAISEKSGSKSMGFRNDGVSFGVPVQDYEWEKDLRNPALKAVREAAFAAMGFKPQISYNDFCIQTGSLSVADQLRYLNR